MKRFIDYSKSRIFRDMSTLLLGTLFSQLVPFLISPLLSRLFLPEDFGLLSGFLAVTGFFLAISTLQLDQAIVIEKDDTAAKKLLNICLIWVSFFAIIVFFSLLSSVGEDILKMYDLNDSYHSFTISICVFFGGSSTAFSSYLLRTKKYKVLSMGQAERSFSISISKLSIGYFQVIGQGLIVGTVIGWVTNFAYLCYATIWRQKLKIYVPRISDSIKLIGKYIDFIKFTSWQGVLDALSFSLTLYFLNVFTNLEFVGFYTFAIAIGQRPVSIIGTQIGKIYFQRISANFEDSSYVFSLTTKMLLGLSVISIFILVPMSLFAEQIFSKVFGENWSTAGLLFNAMVVLTGFKFVVSPFSSIPKVFMKQKMFSIISIVFNLTPPLMFYALFKIELLDKIEIIELVSLVMAMAHALLLMWYFRVIRNNIVD